MANLYQSLLGLLPQRPLQVATVILVDGDQAIVELPGGGRMTVRGQAAVDDVVFVRDGVIEGQAPSLTIVTGDI